MNPYIGCRLAAKETHGGKRDDLFAATPPLEALKLLISMAMTEGIGFGKGWQLTLDSISYSVVCCSVVCSVVCSVGSAHPPFDREPAGFGQFPLEGIQRRCLQSEIKEIGYWHTAAPSNLDSSLILA